MKAIWPCNFMTSQLNKMTPENDQIKRGGICSVLLWWMFSCTSLNFGFLTWLWGSPLGSPSSDPPAPAAPSGLVQACRQRWSACSAAGGKSRVQMEKKNQKNLPVPLRNSQELHKHEGKKKRKDKRRSHSSLQIVDSCKTACSHTHTHTHTHSHTLTESTCARTNTVSGEIKRLLCWTVVAVCMCKHTWLTAPHIKMKALLGNCRPSSSYLFCEDWGQDSVMNTHCYYYYYYCYYYYYYYMCAAHWLNSSIIGLSAAMW